MRGQVFIQTKLVSSNYLGQSQNLSRAGSKRLTFSTDSRTSSQDYYNKQITLRESLGQIQEENEDLMSYLDSGERFSRKSTYLAGSDNIMDYLIEEHNFFNGIEPADPSNPYES